MPKRLFARGTYNLATNYVADHSRVPARIMLTTESLPAKALPMWVGVAQHQRRDAENSALNIGASLRADTGIQRQSDGDRL